MDSVLTAPIYLSRLRLNQRVREVRRDLANPYEMHRTLLSGFPSLPEPTSFRHRLGILHRVEADPETGETIVLVQSRNEPDWTEAFERRILLEADHKEVQQEFEGLNENRLLIFRLRANVTKKIDTKTGPDGKRRNGRRVSLREPAQLVAWLERKGSASGFTVYTKGASEPADCRVLPEQELVARRGQRGMHMRFSSCLFEGRLRVTDRAAFLMALTAGIGPAKAFGFGLLSVAPG